jgi:hypothetical protein
MILSTYAILSGFEMVRSCRRIAENSRASRTVAVLHDREVSIFWFGYASGSKWIRDLVGMSKQGFLEVVSQEEEYNQYQEPDYHLPIMEIHLLAKPSASLKFCIQGPSIYEHIS